jgi:hypothetical protein
MAYAVAILLISALTTVGLLALWAATSTAHWFWRTMGFLAAISPVLLIPAYEPFVAFAIQGAVVAGGVHLAKWRTARKQGEPFFKSQFSLRTVLLAMVPLAVIVAVWVRTGEDENFTWLGSTQIGVAAGILSLSAFWMATSKARFVWRAMFGVVTTAALILLLQWGEWFVTETVEFRFEYDFNNPEWWTIAYKKSIAVGLTWLAVVSVTMACTIVICYVMSTNRIAQKRIAKAFVLILTAPSAIAWFFLIQKPPIPKQELPTPNGYNDYLAAAHTLPHRVTVYSNNFDPDTDSLDVVRTAVEEVQPALDLVRVGLSKDIQKPLNYSSKVPLELHDACRKIGAGFEAAGKLAERQDDNTSTANEYLTLMQFATSYFCESTILDFLLGKASFGRGFSGLFLMRDKLANEDQLRCLVELAKIEQQIEPLEDLLERDNALQIHVFGWREHLRQLMRELPWFDSFMEKAFPAIYGRHIACLRLLQVELALRIWKSEHGDWPESLEALVPSILPAIPLDPFAGDGQSLRYSRTDGSYLLYSVGANGTDEGGVRPERTAIGRNQFTGDLRLDILYEPEPSTLIGQSSSASGDEEAEAE